MSSIIPFINRIACKGHFYHHADSVHPINPLHGPMHRYKRALCLGLSEDPQRAETPTYGSRS